jgi:hypothetical protein
MEGTSLKEPGDKKTDEGATRPAPEDGSFKLTPRGESTLQRDDVPPKPGDRRTIRPRRPLPQVPDKPETPDDDTLA